jgi:hypothetical protein
MKSLSAHIKTLDFATADELLKEATVCITLWGSRVVRVEGDTFQGKSSLDKLALTIKAMAKEREKISSLTPEESSAGERIIEKLQLFYRETDIPREDRSFITTALQWVRDCHCTRDLPRHSLESTRAYLKPPPETPSPRRRGVSNGSGPYFTLT